MRNYGFQRKRYFFIPLFLVAVAAFSAVTMLLWNELMPVIFNLPVINFWQALGLLILARLFFGSGRYWRWRKDHWRHRMMERFSKMSPEQREEFKQKMRERHHFWHSDSENVKDQKPSDEK